jgi:hypothetical protein
VVAGTDGLLFARPTFQERRIQRANSNAICTVSEFRAISSDFCLDGGILCLFLARRPTDPQNSGLGVSSGDSWFGSDLRAIPLYQRAADIGSGIKR